MNDFIALAITFILSILWLRINDFAAQRGWISGQLSRKIIHIGTGPLFVLCWLLFSPAPSARYLAAMVPLLITVQFFLVGIGVIKDEAAVQAMSRTGNPREILRGPLIYGLVFVVLTIWFWKDSPVGMLALMLLCGGDGLADIVGRRWGKTRLPWNQGKSYLGSLGMLAGGWLLAVLILEVFVAAGEFPGPLSAYLPAVTWIALAGALVESLPIPDIDNLTISVVAVALGLILF
jgi:phytol kinase